MASPQNSIVTELYKYNPSGLVELFELDLTPLQSYYTNASPSIPISPTNYYFYNGTNENSDGTSPYVEWNSIKYKAMPVKIEGIQAASSGEIARPTFTVANHNLFWTQANKAWANLAGAKIKRIRTFVKFLDSANFKTRNLFINSQNFDTWNQVTNIDTDVLANVAIAPDLSLIHI